MPTHERDEFILQLVVQTGDHHFHRVPDFADPLVLGPPHRLHVPFLAQQQQRFSAILTHVSGGVLTAQVRRAHHFLHQADELHEASPQPGHLLLHLAHVLLVDLHQRLERVAAVLHEPKKTQNASSSSSPNRDERLFRVGQRLGYHAAPQSALVADAFLARPTEDTQLFVVVFTSAGGDILSTYKKIIKRDQKWRRGTPNNA